MARSRSRGHFWTIKVGSRLKSHNIKIELKTRSLRVVQQRCLRGLKVKIKFKVGLKVIWVKCHGHEVTNFESGFDNLVTARWYTNNVCKVSFWGHKVGIKVTGSRLGLIITESQCRDFRRWNWRSSHWRTVQRTALARSSLRGYKVTVKFKVRLKVRRRTNMPRCRVHSWVTTPVMTGRRLMAPRESRVLVDSGSRTPSTTGRLSVPDGVIRGSYTAHPRRNNHALHCRIYNFSEGKGWLREPDRKLRGSVLAGEFNAFVN